MFYPPQYTPQANEKEPGHRDQALFLCCGHSAAGPFRMKAIFLLFLGNAFFIHKKAVKKSDKISQPPHIRAPEWSKYAWRWHD